MTILYDKTTQSVLSWHRKGYLVDGKKPQLPSNIVELEVVYADKPTPSTTQKVVESWDVTDTQYKQVFTLVNKTAYEIAVDDWKHMEWAIRITVPKSMLFTNIGAPMFAYLQINQNLVVNKDDNDYYVYVNTIEPAFQYIIDDNNLTVENSPSVKVENKPIQ